MTTRVTNIFCHPIKSVGRAPLAEVLLAAGKTMPNDRVWAVEHEAGKFDPKNPAWVSCANFIRGAKAPSLVALSIVQSGENYTITHDGTGESFTFNPNDPTQHPAFITFLATFVPENRAQPKAVVKVPGRGMTDTDFPSISILSQTSLSALAEAAGKAVEMERFRGNIWFDGLPAWEERSWIGKRIRIGEVELNVRENIGRCSATTANPVSGEQDVPTLKILEQNWGHTDLGVYGEVITPGRVALDDRIEIL